MITIKRSLLWLFVYLGAGGVSTLIYHLARPSMGLGLLGTGFAGLVAVFVGVGYVATLDYVIERAPGWWQAHKEAVRRTHTNIALAQIMPSLPNHPN